MHVKRDASPDLGASPKVTRFAVVDSTIIEEIPARTTTDENRRTLQYFHSSRLS